MIFFMYVDKDEKRPEGQTATEYPVIRLLDNEKFKYINLVAATDNWYTRIHLALKLLEWDIYLFGSDTHHIVFTILTGTCQGT